MSRSFRSAMTPTCFELPLIWAESNTWVPQVTTWLKPHLGPNALVRMGDEAPGIKYVDDLEWLNLLGANLESPISEVTSELAGELVSATVRTYHGCRTEDAGMYFRDGLRVHRQERLEKEIRELVARHESLHWLRSSLDERIKKFDRSIDEGKCFVVVDERGLLEDSAHYLIYGSEWICAVLGEGGRGPLLERGTPTVIEVDLPLNLVNEDFRAHFADSLLREWSRQITMSPSDVVQLDFAFSVHFDIPSHCVVGHHHPTELRDPLTGMCRYEPVKTTCDFCTANE